MNNHLSFRSGNPALNKSTFNSFVSTSDSRMTLEGTVNKTGISLLLLMISASVSWHGQLLMFIPIGFIFGIILALVTVFKREWSSITVPLYAIFEGLALGGVSIIFNNMYPGIVSQAIFLTFGILGALLLAYKTGLIKPTENLKLGIAAATGGIAVIYFVNFIMGFFGSGIPLIHSSSPMGIAFSLVVVLIAAFNLVLDFDFIEEGAEKGAPKYMEWYGAFGLLVTLIWLYLEILRLLSKLRR